MKIALLLLWICVARSGAAEAFDFKLVEPIQIEKQKLARKEGRLQSYGDGGVAQAFSDGKFEGEAGCG